VKDLTWLRCDGGEMTQDDWTNPITRCFGLRLAGDAIAEQDAMGRRIVDDTFLVMLNAHHEPMGFTVPSHPVSVGWETVLDTRAPTGKPKRRVLRGGDVYDMEARSFAVLRLRRDSGKGEAREAAQGEAPDGDLADGDRVGGEEGATTMDIARPIRINTANQDELLEIPGVRREDAEAIVRFRDEHGPITDAARLTEILGGRALGEAARDRIDFDPANQTSPEAPGA